jgi:Fe-S-cluster containining protein
MTAPSRDLAARFPADRPFSYVCHRCRNCCHDKLIQVNPYEIARLARCLGVSTTAFIQDCLESAVYLRRKGNGACVFLGPEGCTVHTDRPLVCRLYPLGRHVCSSGDAEFSEMEPHPETKGEYGRDGTVADYIALQGVAPFIEAADRYLAQLQLLYQAWQDAPGGPEPADDAPRHSEGAEAVPDFLDLDRAVAEHCTGLGIPEPKGIEERMQLHLEAITAWLERQTDNARPSSAQER